jgi:uncharacterized protein
MLKNLLAVMLVSFIGFVAAPAVWADRGIKDRADFFSDRAEPQAHEIIDQIYQQHHGKEVLIETLEAAPAGKTPGQYADERINSGAANGLYVVIVKTGGQVSVRAGSETRKLFTASEAARLAQQIDAGLRKGRANWDATLIDAVQSIKNTFDRGEGVYDNAARGGPAAGGSRSGSGSGGAVPGAPRRGFFSGIWGWVCLGIAALVIFNIFRGLSRARRAGYGGAGGYGQGGYGPGPGPGYGYGGGGGGGWGSSLLGGLFGAAAGNWIYDRMFRGGSTQAAPPDAGGGADYGGGGGGYVPPQSDWGGQDVPGGGFSSGDAGGGGDYGGGGGGGGGGDAGGGGGDAGGGGDFA